MINFCNNDECFSIIVDGLSGYYARDIERFFGDLTDIIIGIPISMITDVKYITDDVIGIYGITNNKDESNFVFEKTLGFAKMHNISPFNHYGYKD